MSLFGRLKEKWVPKDENSKAFRRQMAEKISGKLIRYTTERRDNAETVIGHDGNISLRNGQIIVLSGGEIVLRANVDDLRASELLSHDGVILTAPDLEHGGEERTIVAYYLYFR